MANTVTARSRRAVLGAALASLIATLALTVPAAAGGPTTRYVDDDDPGCGPSPYTSVQAAIDVSSPGDTILVCPGEYVGDFFVTVPDLTIRGVQPWAATIVAPEDIDGDFVVTVNSVSGTRIQWLEILAPTVAPTGGTCGQADALIIVVNAPDTRIRANHLGARGTDTLGECGYHVGIEVEDSDDTVVAWNRIVDFMFTGIRAILSDDLDVHGNSARFLHAGASATTQGTGILVDTAEGARVANNVVRSLPSAGASTPQLEIGIEVASAVEPKVIHNRIFHTGSGLELALVDGARVRENRIRHTGANGGLLALATTDTRFVRNLVKGGAAVGIAIGPSSAGNVLRANDARGNAGNDCFDVTAPLANDWGGPTTNLGLDADPAGICSPS